MTFIIQKLQLNYCSVQNVRITWIGSRIAYRRGGALGFLTPSLEFPPSPKIFRITNTIIGIQ